jgi:hypothetical protein
VCGIWEDSWARRSEASGSLKWYCRFKNAFTNQTLHAPLPFVLQATLKLVVAIKMSPLPVRLSCRAPQRISYGFFCVQFSTVVVELYPLNYRLLKVYHVHFIQVVDAIPPQFRTLGGKSAFSRSLSDYWIQYSL